MLGQLEEQEGRTEAARTVYALGMKHCAGCVPLWESAARWEEKAGNVGRARALLEQVRALAGSASAALQEQCSPAESTADLTAALRRSSNACVVHMSLQHRVAQSHTIVES